jgi:hypothetical protein
VIHERVRRRRGKFWKENGGLGLLIWYTLIIRVKMVVTLSLNSKPDLKKRAL